MITGVNPAGDGVHKQLHIPNILVGGMGDVNVNIPPILLRTFEYSRPVGP